MADRQKLPYDEQRFPLLELDIKSRKGADGYSLVLYGEDVVSLDSAGTPLHCPPALLIVGQRETIIIQSVDADLLEAALRRLRRIAEEGA